MVTLFTNVSDVLRHTQIAINDGIVPTEANSGHIGKNTVTSQDEKGQISHFPVES